MNWWGIIFTFVFLPGVAIVFCVAIQRDERHTRSRVGNIPDSVSPWREQRGYHIIEGEAAPFYDWERGDFD